MTVPFCGDGIEGFTFAAEICEDFWAPTPPSTTTALAGAHILCNLSASPITIGKSRERALLCASHSARTVSAYVYTSAGPGESSTDLSWDGQSMIFVLGDELAQLIGRSTGKERVVPAGWTPVDP